MTNQEAIKIIEDECEHIKSHLKCKGKAEDFYKELGDMCIAFYMAIKALEQEPFINKPCISEGVCHEDKNKVLDKIRAEIMSKDGLEEALEIIDKYREEKCGTDEEIDEPYPFGEVKNEN